MARKFDVVIVGTGSAASAIASGCRDAGWQVAVVDSRPFGGTCALRGCDPKKVLVGAAETVDHARRMNGKGIAGDTRIDWLELMRFKRSFTQPVPEQREERFANAGIATFHGRARFTGSTTLRVDSDLLEARYVAVAAGAKPARLNIPGEEFLTTSEQFLELGALPPRIAFVGGGYISFEFAHVAARCGTHATILHQDAMPLAGFDPDLVHLLLERTRQLGVDVHLETVVEGIEKGASGVTMRTSAQGRKLTLEVDMAVHGAGRTPEIDDLGLDAAGVDWDAKSGVKVNAHLQSISNPAVYAAGDAAASGGRPLTPVAGYEGRIVAANVTKGNHVKTEYLGVPTVVFTIPHLAAVGLLEKTARDRGLRFRKNHANTSGWYSSRYTGETHSAYKMLIEEGSGRILGAHLLRPQADELINLFAFAIRSKSTAAMLKEMLFAYPTQASDVAYML